MNILFELRYALRVLMRSPVHTALAVLVVTLSVALAVVTLSLVYNVLYKQLPLPASERWVHLSSFDNERQLYWGGDSVDAYRYQIIKEQSTSFETLGVMRANAFSRLHDGASTTRIRSGVISPELFQAANMRAQLGRTLLPGDSNREDGMVVVISHDLWTSYFAQDPEVVGRSISLDEAPHTVVGVMPPGTHFAVDHQAWIPMPDRQLPQPTAEPGHITPVGVLKKSVSLENAQQDLANILNRVNAQFVGFYDPSLEVRAVPLHLRGSENGTAIYTALMALAAGILLLGCLNVGNLFVARTLERSQEFAIRKAVGSSKLRLFGHSLAESSLVSLLGALIGVPLAVLGLVGIGGVIESLEGVPPHWYLGLDTATIVIASGVVLGSWIVSAIFPLWRLGKVGNAAALVGGRKGGDTSGSFAATKLVVGVEVVASCFLLVVSGGLLLAINDLLRTDYGIETQNRFAVEMELSREYLEDSKRNGLLQLLEFEIEKNPDIDSVAFSTSLPNDIGPRTYRLFDRELSSGASYATQFVAGISPSFMDMLGVEIVQGRGFDLQDNLDAPKVAIVDARFAETMWPNGSALGKQVQITPEEDGPTFTIVGVASNVTPHVKYGTVSEDSILYFSAFQIAQGRLQVLATSTATRAETFEVIKNAVGDMDSSIAVYKPRSLDEHLATQTKDVEMMGRLFTAIGIVTLLLAGTGIYAVISRSVAQQTRDIGVRRAVGSSERKVLGMYLRQGLAYMIVGSVLGGGAAILVNAVLSDFFTGLAAYTPMVLLFVVITLALMVVAASVFPARKATLLEPGDALRYE